MSNGYNGWTNYETWVINLYMDNDQAQERFWSHEAKRAYSRATAGGAFTRAEAAAFALEDRIKDEHQTAAQQMLEAAKYEFGPLADLLNGALCDVNWREIAKSWIERYCDVEVTDATS